MDNQVTFITMLQMMFAATTKIREFLARIRRFVKGGPLHYGSIEILDFFRR
jgi:hypothetical protein